MRMALQKIVKYFLIGVIVFFLNASVAAAQEPEEELVPFETVLKYFNSGHKERKNYVITTKEDWKMLWKTVHDGFSPRPALPDIDFTRRIIIAVFQGEQSDSRLRISIAKLVKIGKELRVFIKETIGNAQCPPGPPVTVQPFHIIETEKIKKPKKKVIFEEPQQEMVTCQSAIPGPRKSTREGIPCE